MSDNSVMYYHPTAHEVMLARELTRKLLENRSREITVEFTGIIHHETSETMDLARRILKRMAPFNNGVYFHNPSYNEINQARWNLYSTGHLNKWFDSWALGHTHGGDLLDDPVNATVLLWTNSNGEPVDMNGKVLTMAYPDSLLDLNPLESVLRCSPVPFILRPPEEAKIRWSREIRRIAGKNYIQYLPMLKGQQPTENQTVVECKVSNPNPGKFPTKF